MAKALIKPLGNLDEIQEIFNDIIEKEKANMAIDPVLFSERVISIKSIGTRILSNAALDELAVDRKVIDHKVYEYVKLSILEALNYLNNKGGVPNELNQVLSIDGFLELSTYNLQERIDIVRINMIHPKVFAHIVTSICKMEKEYADIGIGSFAILNKSLQKTHSVAQKFTSIGSALSEAGIQAKDVLDIIYNYLEGFGKNDAKNAISKIILYLNDQAPNGLLGCVGDYLGQDEESLLYVQPGEEKVFGILDQQFGDDGIAMFSTLPFNARSIILDYTGIEEYYICDTPAVLGQVDSPNS